MSTAGKVLVVLVALLVPVWILLVSSVSQLNTNWAEALDKQRKDFIKLTEEVAKNEQEIRTLKDRIYLEQHSLGEHQAALQSELADVERAKAETIEIQSAIEIQLKQLAVAIQSAEVARDRRTAEKQAETEGKAKAEQEVAELSAQNSQLMDELTALRNDFKSILESNKAMVDRVNKARAQVVPRRAVFVR